MPICMIPDGAGGFRELEVQTIGELAAEWRASTCWCGAPKRQRHIFCPSCYSKLPGDLQIAVYRRVGHKGLAASVAKAKQLLREQGVTGQ